jgi:hypothetical protein
MRKPTAVYLNLSVNDFSQGYTAAQLILWESTLITQIKGMSVKYVFTDTTDPHTTSTDNRASQNNQTLSSGSAAANTRNAALAAGTLAPYDFFIDQRPNRESTIGSGLWKTNGTASLYTGD